MWGLFSFDRAGYPFELFGLPHIAMLFLTFVVAIYIFYNRNKIREHSTIAWTYSLVAILILGEVTFHVWYFVHGEWDMTVNLPLQLSSISMYLCAAMLLTKDYRMFEVAFFVSMTGALIAMITPELFFGYPHMRFFQFFISHMAIVLACLYMLWVERFKPTFRSVLRAFIALNIIAFVVWNINNVLGSNYMFLNGKPNSATFIDYLGPYPWYILSLEVIAIGLFLIIYGFVYWTENKIKSSK
ncbi:YwaF family protein [Alkalibacillus haloalkaliphilus]|uniref:YwaF family protein n=1 Tax=Alkalibacillus haloalkaliphilus TaxID=94136 RepID=UPI002935DA52|nr:TIGR02206 family membrane protein [Alkalibacillus haloalkaliphilus]MDV2583018.1 TIGR02206 family membrane protein [Alkalibacillus haloalkaliphilus]